MKLKWRALGPNQQSTVADKQEMVTVEPSGLCRLTVSILTFEDFTKCMDFLGRFCNLISHNKEIQEFSVTIIVRNNNPRLDSSNFDNFLQHLSRSYDSIAFKLFNDGLNVGYGKGHNLNFDVDPSDYFLILNDDVSFSEIGWLTTGLAILENDPGAGAVGAANSLGSMTPFYGNGAWDRGWHRWPLRYIDGSVMLVRSSVFAEVGKFDPAYEWVFHEDGDLSFRIQSHGYRLEWIDIPNKHPRHRAANILPHDVQGTLIERNRSVLFSKWNTSINQNRIGKFQIFDLWSDGIGDVFVAFLHLQNYLNQLNAIQKSSVIVNTSAPDVARLIFGDDVEIRTVVDLQRLVASYSEAGVRNLKSLRGLNYALPFNMHALVCAALGVPVASRDALSGVMEARSRRPASHPSPALPAQPYCVVHLESERPDHDGRGPSPATTALIASLAAEIFPNLVLVGRNKHLALEHLSSSSGITDLRGRLSISGLIDVITGADSFVGLDSFPAHIAQAANVRSVIFFGSVHPLFRVLSTGQTWPIVKAIDCIGCYHTLLEPTIPYCMRRDLSCTRDIPAAEIRMNMERCVASEPFDWRVLEMRALELQQKFLTTMFFHPDPQRRFLRVPGTPQLATTSLIELVIEQVRAHLVAGDDHDSLASSIEQLDAAKREIHRRDVQIESMIRLIAELRAENAHPSQNRPVGSVE